MSLANAPGKWRWEWIRGAWWRVNRDLNIYDGPHESAPESDFTDEPEDACSVNLTRKVEK